MSCRLTHVNYCLQDKLIQSYLGPFVYISYSYIEALLCLGEKYLLNIHILTNDLFKFIIIFDQEVLISSATNYLYLLTFSYIQWCFNYNWCFFSGTDYLSSLRWIIEVFFPALVIKYQDFRLWSIKTFTNYIDYEFMVLKSHYVFFSTLIIRYLDFRLQTIETFTNQLLIYYGFMVF